MAKIPYRVGVLTRKYHSNEDHFGIFYNDDGIWTFMKSALNVPLPDDCPGPVNTLHLVFIKREALPSLVDHDQVFKDLSDDIFMSSNRDIFVSQAVLSVSTDLCSDLHGMVKVEFASSVEEIMALKEYNNKDFGKIKICQLGSTHSMFGYNCLKLGLNGKAASQKIRKSVSGASKILSVTLRYAAFEPRLLIQVGFDIADFSSNLYINAATPMASTPILSAETAAERIIETYLLYMREPINYATMDILSNARATHNINLRSKLNRAREVRLRDCKLHCKHVNIAFNVTFNYTFIAYYQCIVYSILLFLLLLSKQDHSCQLYYLIHPDFDGQICYCCHQGCRSNDRSFSEGKATKKTKGIKEESCGGA
jgi:hypothetical protein